MQSCPQCGHENAADARFCSSCGAALATETAPPREERKIVTALFADLVGFTARAEVMDPEDVRAVLAPYHARLRSELESYGGTVEKFIGDAVMALFGAPTAHEDDPERAVRAALAIRDWIMEEGGLELRIAVTTGEALINLGAKPSEGEGMASGDVVNTAARLQSAAPVNGILVDESTYRATEPVIVYQEQEAVSAKGKADPIVVWEVVEARSRFGVDTAQTQRAPLIGRDRELDVLVASLARSRAERSPQLVTVVGVPGIGKSRLVYELFNHVASDPDLIYWRQGRSLPYGEGISFWALGEMVKAQVGILETDSTEEAESKLRRSVSDLLGDGDADWVQRHLRPLVGIGMEHEAHADQRVEAFAAWRRFFEAIAEERPLVLVFEDLHWADEGLLDFVDHLVEWATGVPILAVCTARPELLTRRAGWGGGKPNAVTLSLSPLNDEETARLFGALLERSVLPAETQSALLQRAGGNPLYAEEFVRMVSDRGLVAGGEELPMPESVQGIVAARLDGLPEEEKALLQDAAVLGKIFWLGAAAEIGGLDRRQAEERLHELERKEFVRRERRPSVADESEFAFRHLLVRDVAYGQIPRGLRAEKHRLAAEWIESLGRPEDHAEMLAHHYLSCLEFARAAQTETEELRERARGALREAGARAVGLNAFAAAAKFYAAAVELWPPDYPEYPRLLFDYGSALVFSDPARSSDVLAEARDALLAAGDPETAAEAEGQRGEDVWLRGRRDDAFEILKSAAAMVADQPTSRSKATVTSLHSRFRMLAGDSDEAIRLGTEVLEMLEELGGDDSLRANVLNNIGVARISSGDLSGMKELEESVAIGDAMNSPESVRAYGNLASVLTDLAELARASEMVDKGRELAGRFAMWEPIRWLEGESLLPHYQQGRWDVALERLDELVPEFAKTQLWMETPCRWLRGKMRLARGDLEGAQEDANRALTRARVAKDPQLLWPSLAFSAHAFLTTDSELAGELISEVLADWTRQRFPIVAGGNWVPPAAEVLRGLDRQNEILDSGAEQFATTPWLEAAFAYGSSDFRAAADIYQAIGALPEEAYARLRAAEKFVAEGRRPEADTELKRALAFWRSVRATPYVREGEALLAASA
jgi:class 3 adenylate cyclase/tetratricopeptide (TPR) repeat protein